MVSRGNSGIRNDPFGHGRYESSTFVMVREPSSRHGLVLQCPCILDVTIIKVVLVKHGPGTGLFLPDRTVDDVAITPPPRAETPGERDRKTSRNRHGRRHAPALRRRLPKEEAAGPA